MVFTLIYQYLKNHGKLKDRCFLKNLVQNISLLIDKTIIVILLILHG